MLELFDFAVTQAAYVKAAMDEIAAFRPDGLTPAQVQALVDGAAPVRAAYVTKKEAITGARAARHAAIDALHEACVDFAEQGRSRYRKNATVMARFARLPVQDQSFQETLTRGTASEALWTALPQVGSPPAAFTVGQGTASLALAGFTALITAARAADGAIPAADQDFQSAEADVHAKQAELEDFVTAALAQGRSQFAPGTPQREIIDAIPQATDGGPAPTPEPPAAPTGVSFTQENAGDAVVAAADADAAATLWEAHERTAGTADDFVLVSSGATLPVTFTHAPGDFEFILRKTTPAGVSAFSAPITLTVA